MANKGPNTNASQFYMTYAKAPHCDAKYTVFGQYIFCIHY
jgi:peptidyl-prolyl cis-trans isomerase-like 3